MKALRPLGTVNPERWSPGPRVARCPHSVAIAKDLKDLERRVCLAPGSVALASGEGLLTVSETRQAGLSGLTCVIAIANITYESQADACALATVVLRTQGHCREKPAGSASQHSYWDRQTAP